MGLFDDIGGAINSLTGLVGSLGSVRSPNPDEAKQLGSKYTATLVGPAAREGYLPVNREQATIPQLQHAFFARFKFSNDIDMSELMADGVVGDLRLSGMSGLNRQDESIYAVLKEIDAPSYQIDTEIMMAYNKPRTIVKKIEFQPLNVKFHDMVNQKTRNFWRIIYAHYFSDGNSRIHGPDQQLDSEVPGRSNAAANIANYGYTLKHKRQRANLFDSIELYTIFGGMCNLITLKNPTITRMDHGTFAHDSAGMAELTMTFQYDNVTYADYPIHVSEVAPEIFNGMVEGMGEGLSAYANAVTRGAVSREDGFQETDTSLLSTITNLKDNVQKGFNSVHEIGNRVLQVGSRINAAFGVFGVGVDLSGIQSAQQNLRNASSYTSSAFGTAEFVADLPNQILDAAEIKNNFAVTSPIISEEDQAAVTAKSTWIDPNKVGTTQALTLAEETEASREVSDAASSPYDPGTGGTITDLPFDLDTSYPYIPGTGGTITDLPPE